MNKIKLLPKNGIEDFFKILQSLDETVFRAWK